MYNLKLFTMRKIILLLIVGFAVSFIGCNKLGTDPATSTKSQFVLDTDLTALQERLVILNQSVDFVTPTKATAAFDLTVDWNLLSPFQANGATDYLSASSVVHDGDDNVYVGFHDRDKQFYGEIVHVLEGTNAGVPATVSYSLYSETIDVNDLEIDIANNALYLAGESNLRGAEALKIDLTSGVLGTPYTIGMPIFGASGNSVTRIGTDKLWVSSGGENATGLYGGLIELDLTNSTPAIEPFIIGERHQNAKHFDADGAYGLWIQGYQTETGLYVFQNLTDPNTATMSIGQPTSTAKITEGPVTPLGKNAIDVEGDFGYVALGEWGVFKVDLVTSPGSYSKYFKSYNEGFANGIATDGNFVYVANGADGLIVLTMDLVEVGRWNGNTRAGTTSIDNGSCNYVAIGDVTGVLGTDYVAELFVAFGRGGLMKLTFTE